MLYLVCFDRQRQAVIGPCVFYCHLQLLFKLNRPVEVASRGYLFIISFSKSLALHEVFDLSCS